jgi:pimeloyl-ACP methyl ester carboxylesterase
MYTSRTLTIHINHVALQVKHLRLCPKPTARTLVFLHDALGSIAQWKSFPELLCEKCGMDAIVYERQGHGGSSALDKIRTCHYLHDQALETLPKLLKELNINRPVLIGHSDGGSIALIYGAHFHAEAIVTIAAHIFVEQITLDGIRKAVQSRLLLIPRLRKYHHEKTETLFDAWHEIWLSDEFKDWSIVSEIQSITSPVLAIQGENDAYGSIAQIDSIMKEVRGPTNKLILANAGHLPQLEKSEVLAREIGRFIRETNQSG